MFYIDWTYIIIVLPFVILSLIISGNVKLTFSRYSRTKAECGMTGREVARAILNANGLTDVQVVSIGGSLTDHYDPRTKIVSLSEDVYNSSSMAAIGVAAHECGHAIQHAKGYAPLKLRNKMIPVTNFGAKLAIPLIIAGIFLSYLGEYFAIVAYVGVGCFALSALFQLVTLPVEFNASSRALAILDNSGNFSQKELRASKRVLSAAALTYVAALAVTLAQLLRLLIIVLSHVKRKDD